MPYLRETTRKRLTFGTSSPFISKAANSGVKPVTKRAPGAPYACAVVVVEKNVQGLQVSVPGMVIVEVLQALGDVVDQPPRQLLTKRKTAWFRKNRCWDRGYQTTRERRRKYIYYRRFSRSVDHISFFVTKNDSYSRYTKEGTHRRSRKWFSFGYEASEAI